MRVPHHGHAGAEDRVILNLVRLFLSGGDPGVLVPHHEHAEADDRSIVILVRLFLAGGDPGERDPIMNIPELKKSPSFS